ncbi:hypothetical protein ACIP2X_07540 [Streptomyces sp. NPDC089424]|uniref:hypothetical protein n=1 Tax=Streptomyces sp. NPDC089424 TaxID=3365917 RepID=UPI003810CF7C
MACKASDCWTCRPYGMAEWSLVAAHWVREVDDEGIGGVKRPCPYGGWSPFNWRHETSKVPPRGQA